MSYCGALIEFCEKLSNGCYERADGAVMSNAE